ncbi:MAG: EamA family transporter, partial [Armatimonadetes bacterium]|nr:EamA family transporter [Armatimonadota bacterium]
MKSSGFVFASWLAASVASAAPVYQPVPAAPACPRDGLGNVFAKLDAGQEVKIAYFGGSITAAAGWRPKTLQWFQQTWPNAKVSEIHAAIGGTGSDLGVYRLQQDVLRHKPDLIFVEFAVNDGGTLPEDIWRAMEGIVRQVWRQDPNIDICYVYTYRDGYEKDLNQGNNPRAASADEMLAQHYGIPSINVALRVAEMLRDGTMLVRPAKDADGKPLPPAPGVMLFSSGDGVHPNDEAHGVYRDVIAAALQQFRPLSKPGPHQLKEPFIADHWEAARLVPLQPSMLSGGWSKLLADHRFAKSFGRLMPEIWEATQPGESITFRFSGKGVKLYDLVGPDGGQAMVTVDTKTRGPVPRFDSYCTYHRLQTMTVAANLEPGVHEVRIEIDPKQPDRTPAAKQEKDYPNHDPKKYDGTAMRVGALLLLGGNGTLVWAQQRVPSGVAALLIATVPFWIVLLDWLWQKGKRPGSRVVGGLSLGFAGIILLLGQ